MVVGSRVVKIIKGMDLKNEKEKLQSQPPLQSVLLFSIALIICQEFASKTLRAVDPHLYHNKPSILSGSEVEYSVSNY